MKLPIAGWVVDERYLSHRLQASSLGGIAGGLVALVLFGYRYYVNHIWSWDLFVVVAIILGVKLAVMGWCLLTD
ncbi:MAG: hypothetical protein ABSD13_15480 [Candidatus Korobacteraceae bacterium]